MTWLPPKDVKGDPDYRGLIRAALAQPIGTPPFDQVFRPGDKVALVANDITRVMNSHLLVPALLDELNRAGVPDADITVVVATGAHRGHTNEEYEYFLGSADGASACASTTTTAATTPPSTWARRRWAPTSTSTSW